MIFVRFGLTKQADENNSDWKKSEMWKKKVNSIYLINFTVALNLFRIETRLMRAGKINQKAKTVGR